ncbi:protein commissureless 2 homolog isoform X2 [Lycorma delicatula]|uniref:protein commissureless 2 homolog isoform X2 n=1 Tax=Lycorma delicatula TaxID=130591 RepID=UPI003F5116B8
MKIAKIKMTEVSAVGNCIGDEMSHNYTIVVQEVNAPYDADYDRFISDVWIGVVLTLMVLSCVGCLCSCLLYHKFQQWKRSVLQGRGLGDRGECPHDVESLPSYTLVTGLPTYEEALEQLRQVHELRGASKPDMARLSVGDLLSVYKPDKT